MKRILVFGFALLVGAASGCGSTTPANTEKCAAVSGTSPATCDPVDGMCKTANKCAAVSCTGGLTCDMADGICKTPPVPTLGNLIDRLGRPGVNTALTNPFDFTKYATQPELSDATKDRYNGDSVTATWLTTWGPVIKLHLGIYDALDNMCGNQLAYNAGGAGTGYAFLSSVLAGDSLQVDTSKTSCASYLAVEANALGTTNAERGGRTLSMDVIDTTYTVLATGGAAMVTDGISQTTMPDTTFPFMKPPA